jgi:pyruvate dehydrogenase E1 component alpha subunit
LEQGVDTAEQLQDVEQGVEQTIVEAIAFAESSPEPELADLYTHVFKEPS